MPSLPLVVALLPIFALNRRDLFYFDANVVDHLYKRIGVRDCDVRGLALATRTKRIKILASDPLVEELLSTFRSDRVVARAEIGLLLRISDVRRDTIKPHEELVLEDIRAFASGRPLPGRFIDAERGKRLEKRLRRFAEEDIEPAGLTESLNETQVQKERIRDGLATARDAVQTEKKKLKSMLPDFPTYLQPIGSGLVNRLAQLAGLPKEAADKQTPELLKIRSVGMYAGASASLVFAQTFEGRTPKISDSRDLMHAIVASESRVFVTDDEQFRRTLSRVPINDFEVIDLPEFVARYL